MLANSRIIKLAILCFSVLTLTHCAQVSEQETVVKPKITESSLVTPYTNSATDYLSQAKSQIASEKQDSLIKAAGRLIYEGRWRDGLDILKQTADLSDSQFGEKNILLAKIDLLREQPKSAISQLAKVRDVNSLSAFYQVQFHENLASAYERSGLISESVVERIKLSALLDNEYAQQQNDRILWTSLSKLPTAELNTMAVEAGDNSTVQAWMQLALISREKTKDTQALYAQVENWQRSNPNHPGNRLLPKPLSSIKNNLQAAPNQVALLLPLTGPLAGPGSAIRDGFMSAALGAVQVKTYNTSDADPVELYQKAIADGAQYVVGPLTKNEAAKIAAIEHPVPTLLLNDADISGKANIYQFGLSPANEAKQVAKKAADKGLKKALIIAPSGAWGEEITASFKKEWKKKGGQISATLHFGAKDDLNTAIRDLLQVSKSQTRENDIKRLLGSKIETAGGRRQDFDMIFLLAYPSKARQIMPLLRYYYAGDVPVFATSTVYAGNQNTLKDKDLDGIIFSDMPFVFTQQLSPKNWPEQLNSYNRLYALGMDSYALTTQMNQLLLFPSSGLTDKSGVLYLNDQQQVARIPVWGQFRSGTASVIAG